MAKVIGFKKQKLEKVKVTSCPMCNAIIEYTSKDISVNQMLDKTITYPNCKKWFSL